MKCREIPIFGSVWMYTLCSFRIAVFELSGNSEDAFFFFCLFHPTLKDSVPASAVAVLFAKTKKIKSKHNLFFQNRNDKKKRRKEIRKGSQFDRLSVEKSLTSTDLPDST